MDDRIVEPTASQPQINATKLPPTQDRQQKEVNWQAMSDQINGIGDKLGMGIDEGIKEPVIALNLLGVNTGGSCEGHMPIPGHNSPYPYIDVEAKETNELDKKERGASKILNEKLTEKADPALIEKLSIEHLGLLTELRRANLAETEKVINLLAQFYATRNTPFSTLLIAKVEGAGNCRIKPQGGDLQDLEESPEKKQEKLHEYQEEMKAFSSFLKSKYFGEEK